MVQIARGKARVLVVEDDYFIADELSRTLHSNGYDVLGPVGGTRSALDLIASERPDYAIVDLNLQGELSIPVADALMAEHVPFVFASGYEPDVVPRRHSGVPFCVKPLKADELLRFLTPSRASASPQGHGAGLNTRNHLLRALDSEDAALLRPHLQRVMVPKDQVVGDDAVILFPERGLAVARLADVEPAAGLAMVGSEGVLGTPIWPEHGDNLLAFAWQTSGVAVAVARDVLNAAMARSDTLAGQVKDFHRNLLTDVAWTAQANAGLDILGRLSRMILMAADRLGPEMSFTHGGIADLLQVRRASVTEALHKLEGQGAVRSTRSLVTVRDASVLRRHAGASYRKREAFTQRNSPAGDEAARAPLRH